MQSLYIVRTSERIARPTHNNNIITHPLPPAESFFAAIVDVVAAVVT
jgi:hypothetical protein